MKQWLEEDKCRREGYLKVFDEEKKGSVDSCCDLCGLELTDFKTNQPKVSSPRKYLNWKQELQRLLHQDVLV